MNFRWKEEMRDWFRHVSRKGPFKTDFDLYYLCLMLGFATGQTQPVTNASDLTDDFTSDYKEQQRLILGLLLRCELTRYGVSLSDKGSVRTRLQQLVDPNNVTKLTPAGMNALNEYAAGGFQYLFDQSSDKPRNVPEFLAKYHQLLRVAVDANENWQLWMRSQPTTTKV